MKRTLPALLFFATSLSAAEPGSLVIVGGGKLPDSIREKFFALAGKEKARIVVIPTASEDADKPKESESYLKDWKKLNPASVLLMHTRDRKIADRDDFIKPLTEATGIWFSGGDQSRITAAYLGTKTEKAFRNVLERGGVIGGTSAGAAIMSDPMITGGNPVATLDRGFGFLPGFLTDQHFLARKRQARLQGALEKHPSLVGLGIDESTAAVVTGCTLEVIGDSTVTIYLAPGAGPSWFEQSLKAGQTTDLIALRQAAASRAAPEPSPPPYAGQSLNCYPCETGIRRRWIGRRCP